MKTLPRRLFVIAVVILIGIGAAVYTTDGAALFRQEGCSGCHRFHGTGGIIGPDLTNADEMRGTIWIMRQIKDPTVHNPSSRMPSFPHLSFLQRYAIARHLKSG